MNLRPAATLRSSSHKPWLWWLLALGYYVVGCLMHLRFSIWLVSQRETWFGRMAYAEWMPKLVVAGGIGLALWTVLRLRHSPRPWLTGGYWLLWLGAVALIDRHLTFSLNEYWHYPQYALLACLLARALDPTRSHRYIGRVLFWTTLLGMGDELLQYLWITTAYSDYLDFNDFLTNLVAAAAGVLLFYGPCGPAPRQTDALASPRRRPVFEAGVAVALLSLVLAGLVTGRLVPTPTTNIPPGGIARQADGRLTLYLQRGPHFHGSQQAGPRHGAYHVMRPVPGMLLIVLAGLVFASYGWFRRPEAYRPKSSGRPT